MCVCWGGPPADAACTVAPLRLGIFKARWETNAEGGARLRVRSWVPVYAQILTLYVTSGKSLIPLSLFPHLFSWDRELWKRTQKLGAGAGRGSPGARLTVWAPKPDLGERELVGTHACMYACLYSVLFPPTHAVVDAHMLPDRDRIRSRGVSGQHSSQLRCLARAQDPYFHDICKVLFAT